MATLRKGKRKAPCTITKIDYYNLPQMIPCLQKFLLIIKLLQCGGIENPQLKHKKIWFFEHLSEIIYLKSLLHSQQVEWFVMMKIKVEVHDLFKSVFT